MGEDVNQFLAKMAADFDALVGEIERMIEMLAVDKRYSAEIERLLRIKRMAEKGAGIARSKLLPE